MREKNIYRFKGFYLFLTVLLFFSLISPALAEGNLQGPRVLHEKESNPNLKMNENLVKQWSDQEMVTFLVKFNEKVDTKKVAEEAENSAMVNQLSVQQEELQKRSAIVNILKETAATEQKNVLQFLENEVANTKAKNIRSYYIVNAMAVTATKEVAEKIASFSEVEKLLPNETRYLMTPVTDPALLSKSEMEPTSDLGHVEWNVERVHAPEAWEKGYDGSGTVVATIDSGVEWEHPALKDKYRGYNTETGEVDHDFHWFDATAGEAEPYDDQGHGTHVTGTVVGSEADGTNRIGVAPGAKWIAVKAFSAEGTATDTDLLAAAEWIMAPEDQDGNIRLDHTPDVVNNSWGGGPGLDEWYRDVVTAWRSMNILPVFAAGNTDSDNRGGPGSVAVPANYPESFAVGALDVGDDVTIFSLRGPSPYDEIKPDVSVPGQEIRSAVPGGDYAENSGTSMAAPAVSGTAALLLQANSQLDVDEIEKKLMETAQPLTDEEYPVTPNNGYGYGLVDAETAIMAVNNGVAVVEGHVTDANTDLPLQAEISITGKNRSVKTNPDDGSYMLRYAAGEYLLSVSSYGYYTNEQEVALTDDEALELDFSMEKIPERTVSGTVTDASNGEAIEGAYVLLVEDANVDPVKTNAAGEYEFTAHEGNYTIRVSYGGFTPKEIEVAITADSSTFDLELEPFFTYPGGELAYDDGSGEGGSWFQVPGNAWGVRMSLEDGQKQALVTEGKFLFSAGGGDEFQVAVWDANGPGGAPGEMIAGPYDATAVKNGDWTTVDLSDYGILVEEEFYMVYLQPVDRDNAPRLQNDKDEFTYRSWEMYKGFWYALEPNFLTGNKMIRSVVEYEVGKAVITSPEDGALTNEEKVTIEGTATPDAEVEILKNGEMIDTTKVDDSGNFFLNAALDEGLNELVAITYINGKKVNESAPVTISRDTQAPELTIESPEDGERTNQETITISGLVNDHHLDEVTVNGQETTVSEEGAFSQRILLEEGENVIEIIATDQLGNETTEIITVLADYTAPEISDLTPVEDVILETGESVMIQFQSEPGLRTSFVIHMPLTNFGVQTVNATELPMMETTPGNYVGYYTVSQQTYADGAVIEVKVTDDFKNETRKQTEGKLFINI